MRRSTRLLAAVTALALLPGAALANFLPGVHKYVQFCDATLARLHLTVERYGVTMGPAIVFVNNDPTPYANGTLPTGPGLLVQGDRVIDTYRLSGGEDDDAAYRYFEANDNNWWVHYYVGSADIPGNPYLLQDHPEPVQIERQLQVDGGGCGSGSGLPAPLPGATGGAGAFAPTPGR